MVEFINNLQLPVLFADYLLKYLTYSGHYCQTIQFWAFCTAVANPFTKKRTGNCKLLTNSTIQVVYLHMLADKDWNLHNRCHICAGKNCWNGDIWRSPIKSLMFDVRAFYFLSYSLLWSLSLYFPSIHTFFDVIITFGKRGPYYLSQGGVIQQLRGPNFTQFWPPPLLNWTIVDILHTIYSFSRDPPWTFTDSHNPLVHVVIEWPPAGIKADISSVTHDMALQLLTFLNVVVVKLHDIFSIGVQARRNNLKIGYYSLIWHFFFKTSIRWKCLAK